MTLIRRATNRAPEVRAEAGAGKVAKGYAALFNAPADIGGYFQETIAPGAFADALKGDVRALIDHDSGRVIGRTAAGTLRLEEDATGLRFEVDLPDTTDGRDLAVQLERGDITGMSIGFAVTHDEWDETGNMPKRTIHKVELFEISAVAFPAYEDTSIALRTLEAARDERKRHNVNGYLRRKAETDHRARGL
jgi:HK97 family phage prohead protease